MEGYEIVANIGKGSSGSVFLAKGSKSKKLFAIKKIEIDENRRSRCKKSVVREASILRRLTHPYIVECEEWFLDAEEKVMSIVLEYCNGGTMQDLVRAARNGKSYFPEEKVLKWMTQITSAVAYMHERRILHRDLKTENVFMVKPDNAKLGDFGISKEIDHTLDLAQTCVGTPCYLSPELCQDIPYNSKSDVWALGCLLFEMAGLKPAFDAANLVSLFYKIVKGDFADLPEDCTEKVHDLISICLQKDPEDRPTAAKLLEHRSLSDYVGLIRLRTNRNPPPESKVSLKMQDGDAKGKQRPPKLADLRDKSGPIEELPSYDTWDTITNDEMGRTQSPGPAQAYNMFLSGVKSKSTIETRTNQQQNPSKFAGLTGRSLSVLETKKGQKVQYEVPKIFNGELPEPEEAEALEVETARPQTCPHSASRVKDHHQVEDTSFTDTVVTWSGYGDRGSRHPSGRHHQRGSISLSSGSDSDSSDYEYSQKMTPKNGGDLTKSIDYDEDSDSISSYDGSSDGIAEELVTEEPGDDDIPEVIEDGGDDANARSTQNGDVSAKGDNSRTLPGSAWLRSKRLQVMERKTEMRSENRNNNNRGNITQTKKKEQLPESSWITRKRGLEQNSNVLQQESGSDDAIVLGQGGSTRQRTKRKSGKIRNLPGSAWLKKSRPKSGRDHVNKSTGDKNPPSCIHSPPRECPIVLESCSSSAAELSSPEKKASDSDLESNGSYSYPDDFDDYEDDFELSEDDVSAGEDDLKPRKSSLNVVRQGCIDMIGESAFEDLSMLFKKGLTLSEVVSKFKKRKIDAETLETCYLLLHN